MKQIKWTKGYSQWTFEKEFPIFGSIYGEINEDSETGLFCLYLDAMDHPYCLFGEIDEIKTLEQAKKLAHKEIERELAKEFNKLKKFLGAK